MTEPMPEKEQFQEWLSHPVTKSLREWAGRSRLNLMEGWANGEYAAAFRTEMIVKNAGAAASCDVFAAIVEMDYDRIFGEHDAK